MIQGTVCQSILCLRIVSSSSVHSMDSTSLVDSDGSSLRTSFSTKVHTRVVSMLAMLTFRRALYTCNVFLHRCQCSHIHGSFSSKFRLAVAGGCSYSNPTAHTTSAVDILLTVDYKCCPFEVFAAAVRVARGEAKQGQGPRKENAAYLRGAKFGQDAFSPEGSLLTAPMKLCCPQAKMGTGHWLTKESLDCGNLG